jgi:hypothetical protein
MGAKREEQQEIKKGVIEPMRIDKASMAGVLKACLCVGAIALTLATTANAQSNAGYENGLTDWATFNFSFCLGTGTGASGTMASGSPHGGLNVLQAYGPFTGGWDASGASQDILTSPGVSWTLTGYGMNPSADAMAVSGLGFGIIQLAWIDSGGATISAIDSAQIDKSVSLQDQWQALSASGVAPVGTVKVRLIALHVGGPDFAGGSAYFDDLAAVAVPEPSSIALVLSGLLGVWMVSRKRRV